MPLWLRHCVPVWTIRSCFRAASTIRRPSLTLWLTGFSTYTSLPAWQAQIAASACQWLGVAIEMASIVLSSSRRRMSCTTVGAVFELSFDHLGALGGRAEIDVADRGDAHVLELAPAGDVLLAPAVDAANGHPHGVVRPARLGIAIAVVRGRDGLHSRNRGHCSREFGRVRKKLSARQRAHGWDPRGELAGGRRSHAQPI